MGLRTVRASRRSKRGRGDYPVGTIAYYGLDDQVATKVVVGILDEQGRVLATRRWYEAEGDVRISRRITREIAAYLKQHKVVRTVGVDRILGCPHEEGLDFPRGQTCPVCTFWSEKCY